MQRNITWSYWCGVGMLIPLAVWVVPYVGTSGYLDWQYLPLALLVGLIPVLFQAFVLHRVFKFGLVHAFRLAWLVAVLAGLIEIILLRSCFSEDILVTCASLYWEDGLSIGVYPATLIGIIVPVLLYALSTMLLQTPVYIMALGYANSSWQRLGVVSATTYISQVAYVVLLLVSTLTAMLFR